MPKVNYRAIHSMTRWRKVGHHASLSTAIAGEDGARALFLGNARIDYHKHGSPIGVLAWEDGAETTTAVRPNPTNPSDLQRVEFPVELAIAFEARRGVDDSEFLALFEENDTEKFRLEQEPESPSLSDLERLELQFQEEVRAALKLPKEQRAKKLANASRRPDKREISIFIFQRSPDVAAEVLLRANGICENCGAAAPFRRAKDD